MILNMLKRDDEIKVILNSHLEIKISKTENIQYASINGVNDYKDHKILLPKNLELKIIGCDRVGVEFEILKELENFKKGMNLYVFIKDMNGKLNFEYIIREKSNNV